MATQSIIKAHSAKALVKASPESSTFHVRVEETENTHKAQAFIDYGDSPGPWIKLGFNTTVYAFGYLPEPNPAK